MKNLAMGMLLVIGGSADLTCQAARTSFELPGRNLGVWQLTHDPAVRHWANYHNVQSFSPDGRYVCYIAQYPDKREGMKIFDLWKNEEISLGPGVNPRWAKHHNWLFFAHFNDAKRTKDVPGKETIMYDVEARKRTVVIPLPGAEWLGGTTFDDQWLTGAQRYRRQKPEFRHVRIRIPDGGFERMPEVVGSQLLPNPRHPVFFSRADNNADPFKATRYFWDLDGSNRRLGVPTLQKCHMSWLGNGEFLLLGNGLVRGRKWNEPFPSNVEILANVSVGDISPCGNSGRWVCGDSSLADLRSGDGWETFHPLSIVCFPEAIGDASGIYDADPKSSPDGTKISFVSNYPLNGGPQTLIMDSGKSDVTVASTEGFPASGRLVVGREVVAYTQKTATKFLGLKRQMHGTAYSGLKPGRVITSFESRLLTDEEFTRVGRHIGPMRKTIPNTESPLFRQRMTNLYVAKVRRPDRPFLRRVGNVIEVIPGENHRETRGYLVGTTVLIPGARIKLPATGTIHVRAREWSDFESEKSNAIELRPSDELKVLEETPKDFSWTSTRRKNDLRETVHVYDGVIRREWFERGVLTKRHDLNQGGKATRRIAYEDGRRKQRSYFQPDGDPVSVENFDAKGFVTEQTRFASDGTEIDHWWFDEGWPVKRRSKGTEWIKRGDRWGYFKNGKWIDTPR
ncbi:MAG: hypothetical protein ACPGVU_01500 [Limisphaerales bacterium]